MVILCYFRVSHLNIKGAKRESFQKALSPSTQSQATSYHERTPRIVITVERTWRETSNKPLQRLHVDETFIKLKRCFAVNIMAGGGQGFLQITWCMARERR